MPSVHLLGSELCSPLILLVMRLASSSKVPTRRDVSYACRWNIVRQAIDWVSFAGLEGLYWEIQISPAYRLLIQRHVRYLYSSISRMFREPSRLLLLIAATLFKYEDPVSWRLLRSTAGFRRGTVVPSFGR